MVLPGQYLERATLVARPPSSGDGEGVTLEALFHRGSLAPGVVVCAPHPRMGGSMDSPVVAELAWALTRAGHATLRFNYQGVGASGGTIQTPIPTSEILGLEAVREEARDAAAAAGQLAESTGHGRIALAGYSFGAAVALSLALERPEVTHLLLVAPPTTLFDFTPLTRFDRPLFVAAGQHDRLVDRSRLQPLLEGRNVRFELVAGADHTFTRGLTELGQTAARWLDAARAAHP